MSFLRIKKLLENTVLIHPLDQKLWSEGLVRAKHAHVLDDVVQVSNTMDPSLHIRRSKAKKRDFKLKDFSLFLTFVLSD